MAHYPAADPLGMGPTADTVEILVRLDQQQCQLLEFLRQEGAFGKEDGEIVANVVRAYLKQAREDGAL